MEKHKQVLQETNNDLFEEIQYEWGCWSFTSLHHLRTSVRVPVCDSVYLWRNYSAAPLENQVCDTMTQYPTQLHYPDTELTSACPHPINAESQAQKQQL